MRLTVPGDPVPKARPRVVNGRAYTDRRTVAFENLVADHARAARLPLLAGPVRLCVVFWRGTARRCDLDNLTKAVQDALNGIAWDDDDQVVDLHAVKLIDREHPRTELEVSACPPQVERVLTVEQLVNAWDDAWTHGHAPYQRRVSQLPHAGKDPDQPA